MAIYEIPEVFKKAAQASFPKQNEELTQKATHVLGDLADKYPSWTAADVHKMRVILNDARSVAGEARTRLIKEDLFKIAHDIKGQGATFCYPLMTDLGASICAHVRAKEEYDKESLDMLRVWVEDMDKVLLNKLKGDGGSDGNEIRARLGTGA